MLFVFSLIRGSAAVLRKLAAARHERAQRFYETRQTEFDRAEQDCKAGEVRVGRPMDYPAQLRLLKLYEAAEQARQRWMRRAQSLNSRRQWEERVLAFRGRKLPYTFGLIDMALVMQVVDQFGVGVDFALLSDWLSAMR